MNVDTPFLLLYAIAAAASAVWLLGLWFLLSTARRGAVVADFWDDDYDMPIGPGETMIPGSAEVAGRPAELAGKAAAHLAAHGAVGLGPVKILQHTESRVAFEALPQFGGRFGSQFAGRAVLEFHALDGDRTHIDYAVTTPRRGGLLVAAWMVQILGLIVLVVGFLVIHTWVAPHPHPAVRWQTLQMLQVGHLLWPPFLFCGLYRRVQTHTRTLLDGFVHNLPYLQG